ncbi:MAG TPA: zinc metallopeptidase, partial [Chitinophagaceae bacterium]|nr:zinc metallopeptidase [Chitinophagaceae bacterium]
MTPSIMFVSLFFVGISMIISLVLKSKFTAYGKIPLANGMTGREVAEKMLRENGIFDVKVISADGFLSDHYNPAD